ncbi:hypothetical protein D3C77_613630 [compost metagenome]
MVADLAYINRLPPIAVPLIVVERAHRPVNRQLMKIRSPKPDQLRIRIGEQAALQQRIIGEINPWHDMPWMEGHLLRLRKYVVHVTVQRHFSDQLYGNVLFRPQLGRVEDIEVEFELVFFREKRDAELIFGIIALLNRFP